MSEDMISVVQKEPSEPMEFSVTVHGHGTSTKHDVTVSKRHHAWLTSGGYEAVQLIEAAFMFLLDREPKEAILRRFDVTTIANYFPEFESELPLYLSRVGAPGAGSAE